jgi:NitT/TauT family transport system substrate-binding protein
MDRSRTPLAMVALVAVVATFFTGALFAGPVSAEVVRVQFVIGLKPLPPGSAYYSSVPTYLKFFIDEGLDVDMHIVEGGNTAARMLALGSADIALTASEPIFVAIDQGGKMKMVFSFLSTSHLLPAVLDDSPIRTIAEFKGKKIGTPSIANATTTALKALLGEAGIDPQKDVSIIPIGVGAQAATALTRKNVDAAMMLDVHWAAMESLGLKFRYLTSPALERLVFNQVLTTTDAFAKRHPDAVARFGRAVAKGTLFSQLNPEAAIRIHFRVFPESKPTNAPEAEIVKKELHAFETRIKKTMVRPGERWGAATDDSVLATRDMLLVNGVIKHKLPVSAYWSPEFLGEINKFDAAAVTRLAKEFTLN